MEDNQKKYLDFYKTYAEQFADATKEQSDAVEALNKALATNTLLTNMDDTDKFWDLAKSLFDEDYIREYPDFKGGGAGSSSSWMEKLLQTVRQTQSVYDSLAQNAPNLLNAKTNEITSSVEKTGKSIMDEYNESKNTTWYTSQTLNINNPGLAMNYDDFVNMMDSYWAHLNQQSQIGKK